MSNLYLYDRFFEDDIYDPVDPEEPSNRPDEEDEFYPERPVYCPPDSRFN